MNTVVITARMDSDRLPGKAMAQINGEPNLARVVRRFAQCHTVARVTVATTRRDIDAPIVDWCRSNYVDVYCGDTDNVAQRVLKAAPGADYILRATCDCPFISWEITDAAFNLLNRNPNWEGLRVWGAADRVVPVYGSSEMPFSRSALLRMLENPTSSSVLEHLSGIDENREQYNIYYPVAPSAYYGKFFRPYRLELDTPDDLRMVSEIYSALQTDVPSIVEVVDLLDRRPDIASINSHVSEKTGPMSSYSPEIRARWKSHQTQRAVGWTGDWWWVQHAVPVIVPRGATPVYCTSGKCFLGYSERMPSKRHKLIAGNTVIIGRAELKCDCGAGRAWYPDGNENNVIG